MKNPKSTAAGRKAARSRRAMKSGSPEDLRRQALALAARAKRHLDRAMDLERLARVVEKKRDKWERQNWPEEFCAECRSLAAAGTGRRCLLHRSVNVDSVNAATNAATNAAIAQSETIFDDLRRVGEKEQP